MSEPCAIHSPGRWDLPIASLHRDTLYTSFRGRNAVGTSRCNERVLPLQGRCGCVTMATCLSGLRRGPQRWQRPIAVLPLRAAAAGYAAEPQIVPSQLPKPSAPPAKLPTPPESGSLLDVRLQYRIAHKLEVAGTTRIMLLSHAGSRILISSQRSCSQVVPYLSRLAVSDKQLYWRLAASLTFMIVSKAAGEKVCIVLD